MKQYNERQVTWKELREEKESPLTVFKIKYQEYGSPLVLEKLFQKKKHISRYVNNPLILNIQFWVCEIIENK